MNVHAVEFVVGAVKPADLPIDKLPEIDAKLEVLIPTGNFTEQARDWEFLMETEAGRFEKTARIGHPEAIHPHDPEAQLRLKSGTTFDYPELLVRAK